MEQVAQAVIDRRERERKEETRRELDPLKTHSKQLTSNQALSPNSPFSSEL